jgi:uncharacterized protein YfcZ (UPF0381/DUF406 family)
MRAQWKKPAAIGFLVFLVLWSAGTIRGLALPFPRPTVLDLSGSSHREDTSRLANAHNLVQLGLGTTPLPVVLDQGDIERIQVYEKSAHITTGTAAFDEDQALLRAALTAHQATIFNERSDGIAPARRLTVELGVHPERFDALVERLRQVGQLESIGVQQRDRTGEFRRLYAQRQSLKKYLESVTKLRGVNNPSIDDTLKIEQKIQDVEKELQALSVQLGDLLGKESFYHIQVTLFEYQEGSRLDRSYTLPQRCFHAFLWALAWWLTVAATLAVLAATAVSIRTLWPRAAPTRSTPQAAG